MRKLFLSIFGVFCGILVIIGTFNNYQLQKISEYQIHLQQVDQLVQDLNAHSNRINFWVTNPNSWDYLASNKTNTISQLRTFWNKHISKANRTLKNDIVKSSLVNDEIHEQYFGDLFELSNAEIQMIKSLAKAGFKDDGAIGAMRKIAHKLEKNKQVNSENILSIRRNEKDFLLRKVLIYDFKIHHAIARWRKQPNYPVEMDEYEIYFSRYSSSIQKIFTGDSCLFNRWKIENKKKLELLHRTRINLLNYNLVHSQNIQKFNVVIYISILCAAIILSVYFSKKLSESIIIFQRTIEKYIKSNYANVEILNLNIPKNEFGKLMLHFLQLSNKINNDFRYLEDRVERRTKTLKEKNDELLLKHHEIAQGMRYAKDIQQSLMSNTKELSAFFGKFRLYFQSKDLVGGDFYWSKSVSNDEVDLRFFALADCTGHGVSGAMLSIFGMQSLDEIIGKGLFETGEILNQLRWNVSHRLNRNNDRRYDGMDIALFSIDYHNKVMSFSGANLSVWIIDSGEIVELKGQRMPIGWTDTHHDSFKSFSIQLFQTDRILVFSDGISDQFGGERDKKWGRKEIKSIVNSNLDKGIDFLFDKIMFEFENWKAKNEQTDDCTMVMIDPFHFSPTN
jgi:sigma-B regulation protein RsbU (phosphoserine phosphatase)